MGRTTKTLEKSTSTSTVSDEREALAGAYVDKAELAQQRGAVSEQQLPEPVHAEPVIGEKVTSPDLASLASKYMDHADPIVRRLAASVLSQAEGGADVR